MAVLTLNQAAVIFHEDEILSGIVDTYLNINPIFELLPWRSFDGQAITVNKVDTYGNVELLGFDAEFTANSPTLYDKDTFYPKTIGAVVELNGLQLATSSAGGVNERANQMAFKAKEMANKWQRQMAVGTGLGDEMNSVRSLVTEAQTIFADGDGESAGAPITFELLDELRDKVRSDGMQCDGFMMSRAAIRKVRQLLRGAGGVTMAELNGRQMEVYDGIFLFTNDYLDEDENNDGTIKGELDDGGFTSIYAMNLDDGTNRGVAAVYPSSVPLGVQVKPVGQAANKDKEIIQLVQYTNFVNFNELGLARLAAVDVKPAAVDPTP